MWSIIAAYGFVLLGLGFVLCGVIVIWWALFADRSRGRKRCPRCWHDLSRTQGMVCTECGRTLRNERELYRTRRRWRAAAVTFCVLILATGWVRFQATATGWSSLMPTSVLITFASWMEPPGSLDEGWRDLTQRLNRRELSAELQLAMADQMAGMRNDDIVRPAPTALLMEVLRRDPPELISDPDLSEAENEERDRLLLAYKMEMDALLAPVPFAVGATLPARWISDVPLSVSLQGTYWGQLTEWRAAIDSVSAVALDANGREIGASLPLKSLRDEWIIWNSSGRARGMGPLVGVLQVEPLPMGKWRVTAEVAAEARRWDWDDGEWGPWNRCAPAKAVQVIDISGAPDVVQEKGTLLDEAIRRVFNHAVVSWNDDARPVGIQYTLRDVSTQEYADLLAGISVELLEDGKLRRRLRFWWRGISPDGFGWKTDMEDKEALKRLQTSSEGWTMRVSGDLPTALRALDSANPGAVTPVAPPGHATTPGAAPAKWRTWVGTLEWPLQVQTMREPASVRIWRTEPRAQPAAK